MNDLAFQKSKVALLIIDMQKAFVYPEGSLSRLGLDTSRTTIAIEPVRQLKAACREAGRPVLYLQHTHRPDGSDAGLIAKVFPPIMAMGHCVDGTWDQEIIDELRPEIGDIIIKKHRFSGFYHTQLEDVLRSLGVEQLIVAGIATNICVESTIRDAFYRDINVFVPREATASYTAEQEESALGNFRFAFARVITLAETLALLAT